MNFYTDLVFVIHCITGIIDNFSLCNFLMNILCLVLMLDHLCNLFNVQFCLYFQTSSAFSDEELTWGFTSTTSSTAPPISSSKKSKSPKSKSPGSKSNRKKKNLSREEQEEADYQFALKLSRGEVPDSSA